MALHLSTDFNLQEWVTAVLPILRAKNLLLLEGAERGGNIEAPELTYFSQQQVARVGTVTTAAAADATSIVVNEDFAKRLTAGYLLMIGEEVLNVTAVNLTNNTLTVWRWYGSTPAAAIAKDATIKIMSKAEKEDGITEDYKAVGSVSYKNVVQTFTKSIYVTKEAAIYRKKDMGDLLDLERIAKFDEMAQEIDKTLYYGRQKLAADRKTMGWWKEAINFANGAIYNANGSLSEDDLEAVLLTIAQRRGEPTGLYMNSWTKNQCRKAFKGKVYNEDRGNQWAGTRLTRFVSDALGYDLPFFIDEEIENWDIFIGKAKPLVHVMEDREFGNDIFFAFYAEPSNSQVINETLKSAITAEFQYANQDGYIYNAAAGVATPKEVKIVNSTEEPVNTKEVTGE